MTGLVLALTKLLQRHPLRTLSPRLQRRLERRHYLLPKERRRLDSNRNSELNLGRQERQTRQRLQREEGRGRGLDQVVDQRREDRELVEVLIVLHLWCVDLLINVGITNNDIALDKNLPCR